MSFLINLGKNFNSCCLGASNIIKVTGTTATISSLAYICIDYAAKSFLIQRNLSHRTFEIKVQNEVLKEILPMISKIESEIAGRQQTTVEIASSTLRNTASFLVALCLSSYLSATLLKQGKLKTVGMSAITIASLKSFLTPDEKMTSSFDSIRFSNETILTILEKTPPIYPLKHHGLTFYFKFKLSKHENSTQLALYLNSPTNELEITIQRDPTFKPDSNLKIFRITKDDLTTDMPLDSNEHKLSFPSDGLTHTLSVVQLFQKGDNKKEFFESKIFYST